MNLDFALILVVLTAFSGVVWLIDSLAFRQRRMDRAVRLESFYCFGECTRGPNVRIDGVVHNAVDPHQLRSLLDELRGPGPAGGAGTGVSGP